jgi:hypothetical protein
MCLTPHSAVAGMPHSFTPAKAHMLHPGAGRIRFTTGQRCLRLLRAQRCCGSNSEADLHSEIAARIGSLPAGPPHLRVAVEPALAEEGRWHAHVIERMLRRQAGKKCPTASQCAEAGGVGPHLRHGMAHAAAGVHGACACTHMSSARGQQHGNASPPSRQRCRPCQQQRVQQGHGNAQANQPLITGSFSH